MSLDYSAPGSHKVGAICRICQLNQLRSVDVLEHFITMKLRSLGNSIKIGLKFSAIGLISVPRHTPRGIPTRGFRHDYLRPGLRSGP